MEPFMTEVVAIIPARFASKRLPGKALADICGKPLIRRVYERVALARGVSRVVVATDDDRIAQAVVSFGGEVMMTSANHASGTSRVAEAARATGGDIIVNVQGDEPLIDPAVIEAVVGGIKADSGIVCSTAAFSAPDEETYRDPNAVKVVIDNRKRALYFSRSPIPCDRDGAFAGAYIHVGIYCFRREFLERYGSLQPAILEERERLEQLRILENGEKIGVVLTASPSIGVDTPEDLVRVRALVAAEETGRG
jgi:3-deoxy-manno-octulosonate cytidylyltransferase (CMP-KDO synthetase)